MRIQQAIKADFNKLIEIWEASVQATHDFLSDEHINQLRPLIQHTYLPMLTAYKAINDKHEIRHPHMTPLLSRQRQSLRCPNLYFKLNSIAKVSSLGKPAGFSPTDRACWIAARAARSNSSAPELCTNW